MYKIILASNSPRRRELLSGLGLEFEVKVIPGISEDYPSGISAEEVAKYIAKEKAEPYRIGNMVKSGELVLTADTIVVIDGEILGKPQNDDDAK